MTLLVPRLTFTYVLIHQTACRQTCKYQCQVRCRDEHMICEQFLFSNLEKCPVDSVSYLWCPTGKQNKTP